MNDIIQKIKKAKLVGRGGACFPTAIKWQAFKKAKRDKKYIICNVSEGEPGVYKDKFILENFAEQAIDGIKIALDYFDAEKAYFYINPRYFQLYRRKLRRIIKDSPIQLFSKNHQAGYIGGEETAAINHIEGKKIEPRLKPPFPGTSGLWGCPTLINNLETFYNIKQIADGDYRGERLFSINGDCLERGVFSLDENWNIDRVLKETKNYPKFDFFVQVGGDASGEILNREQLGRSVPGAASIRVYSLQKHKPIELFKKWIGFFAKESCGQCTPCREGLYRLKLILSEEKPDWETFAELLNSLSETSFCGLGCAAPIAVSSYVKNVLPKFPSSPIKLPNLAKKIICDCF